jgi:hypothetical protein
MGCSLSTNEKPLEGRAEEELITLHERDLGLFRNSSALVEASVRRVGQQGTLTAKQLDRLASMLGLDLRPLADSSTSVAKFFSSLQTDSLYDADTLVILGILLGSSTAQEKRMLLSQQADPDANELIEEEDLNKTLTDLAWLAGVSLPLLALQHEIDVLIEKYIDKLKSSVRPLVVGQVCLMLRGRPSIPCSEFRSLLESTDYRFWLSPGELRQKLLSLSTSIPVNFSTDSFKDFEERFIVQKTEEISP